MNESAYIISLKYAPGSNKEFVSLGERLAKNGFDIRYLIAEPYKNLGENLEKTEYITTSNNSKTLITDTIKFLAGNRKKTLKRLFDKFPPMFICFYNPHPLNPFIARMVKKNFPETITAVYLHEPYKPDKSFYGWKKSVYINIVEKIQEMTVKYTDHIISPSEYSQELFKIRYPKFNGKMHLAPLLISDRINTENINREFFSIVGNVNNATGHDTFLKLINYVARKGLNYKFVLISSSNISKFLKNLSIEGRKILKIVNKKIITDSEINQVITKSYAVFRLEKELTQSGVIPVAYMNKTPVIVRNIRGLRQHTNHKYNGYIVPFNCSMENIVEAMNFVKKNFTELSKNARKSYEETWDDRNFDKYYRWLIDLLKPTI